VAAARDEAATTGEVEGDELRNGARGAGAGRGGEADGTQYGEG